MKYISRYNIFATEETLRASQKRDIPLPQMFRYSQLRRTMFTYCIAMSMANVLTSYIHQFHQFRPSQIRPTIFAYSITISLANVFASYIHEFLLFKLSELRPNTPIASTHPYPLHTPLLEGQLCFFPGFVILWKRFLRGRFLYLYDLTFFLFKLTRCISYLFLHFELFTVYTHV